MKAAYLLFFTLCLSIVTAQDAQPAKAPGEAKGGEKEHLVAEEQAEYPGGLSALFKFLSTSLTLPEACRGDSLRPGCCQVRLSFLVTEEGRVTDIEVNSRCWTCREADEALKRILAAMPRWKPARQDGKPISIRYTLPMRLRIS